MDTVFLRAYIQQGIISSSWIIEALQKHNKLSKKEKFLHIFNKLKWPVIPLPGLESKTWNDHLFLKSQDD